MDSFVPVEREDDWRVLPLTLPPPPHSTGATPGTTTGATGPGTAATTNPQFRISTTCSPVSAISRSLEHRGMMTEGEQGGGGGGGWVALTGQQGNAHGGYQHYPAHQHSQYHQHSNQYQNQHQNQQQQYPYHQEPMRENIHAESSTGKRKHYPDSEIHPPPTYPYTSLPAPSSYASTPNNTSSASASAPPPSFVACTKCRHRKIKCGGQRPNCENCEKKELKCVYDVVVKRRGPDKKPGGRTKKRASGGVGDSGDSQQQQGEVKQEQGQGQGHVISPTSTNTPSSSSSAPHLMDESRPIGVQDGTRPCWNISPHDHPASLAPTGSNSPETVLSIPRSRAHSITGQRNFLPPVHGTVPPPLPYGYAPPRPNYLSPPQPWQRDHGTGYPAQPMGPPAFAGYSAQAGTRYPDPPFYAHPGHGPYAQTTRPSTFDHTHPHSYQHDRPEVWSPSVVGKLGMADLVTGYDPVQHIAAGANVGMHETEASLSLVKSENGDDEPCRAVQPYARDDAFARGLKLERLPNTSYARESDWVWMTGLFSTNWGEGIRILDTELRFFFDMNMQWFQFLNRSLFFTTLYHDVDRYEIQPALILSMLAITTLVKSANQGPHAIGKQNAITFADAARSMIQQSIVANKVDPTLAQAALVLMAFEFYPYPQHSQERTVSAVHLFDSIAHMFQLLASDVSDDRVSIFIPGAVPVLTLPTAPSSDDGEPGTTHEEIVRSSHEAEEEEEIKQLVKWSPQPQWPVHWSVAQVRQDEARRMCWTASSMIANYSCWTHTLGLRPLELYMSNPANYALFFPAEPLLVNKAPVVGKQTMWALYNRVVLLWHFTLKSHHMDMPSETRALLYEQIWHETHRIEEALFHIGMNAGQTQKWQARDWIINTLSLITENFTRFTPGMLEGSKTGQAASAEGYRSWVKQQAELGALLRGMSAVGGMQVEVKGQTPPPAIISRPFFVWPLLHMVHNALTTFNLDHTRFETIKIATTVLTVVKTISDAWPNPILTHELVKLQAELNRIVEPGAQLLPEDWRTRPILTAGEQEQALLVRLSGSPP